MVTFGVIVSRQPDHSAPCSPLPATSHVTKFPVVHPLSIQQVTKCFSRNSFVLKTIHFDGGCVPPLLALHHDRRPLDYLSPIPYPLSPFFSNSCALLCTFLHPSKTQLFCFHAIPHSLPKTTRGGGTPTPSTRIKMTQASTNAISASDTRHRLYSHSTRGEVSPHTRFASHPCRFLVNYSDPILHRVGPSGRFPCSTQRPRS
jgi:hypothetical protein